MDSLRVLELYSGIGGMHYALKESGVPAQVVAAVDINTTANQIYRHNFPDTPLWPKTIEGISLDDFNKLSFDMILMSPPCQPFTRIGLQGDVADPRTKSFLYILDLLPRLARLPLYILLENVKGFETSSARDRLVKTLKDCGYSFQEIMVSPTSVGIPNSRLRYFLIAKASARSFSFQTSSEILDGFPQPAKTDSWDLPPVSHPLGQSTCQQEESVEDSLLDQLHITKTKEAQRSPEESGVLYKLETTKEAQRKSTQNSDVSVQQIQDFLELRPEMDHYLLPPKVLLRYGLLMDIVTPTCRRSVCFTKGYGHYVEGTGSVLQSCMDTQVESVFSGLEEQSDEDKLQQLLKLKLRYFTPREIANLMGFPQGFAFPEQMSTKQQYRVLGNSLNVVVVARLIQLLVS